MSVQTLALRVVYSDRRTGDAKGASIGDVAGVLDQLRDISATSWLWAHSPELLLEPLRAGRWPLLVDRDIRRQPAGVVSAERAPEGSAYVGKSRAAVIRDSPILPRVTRLHLESPLEVLLNLPPAFVGGGGTLTALVFLLRRIWTTPLRISLDMERLRADRAEEEVRRRHAEKDIALLEQQIAFLTRSGRNFDVVDAEVFDLESGREGHAE
jgi:hypothetical protein